MYLQQHSIVPTVVLSNDNESDADNHVYDEVFRNVKRCQAMGQLHVLLHGKTITTRKMTELNDIIIDKELSLSIACQLNSIYRDITYDGPVTSFGSRLQYRTFPTLQSTSIFYQIETDVIRKLCNGALKQISGLHMRWGGSEDTNSNGSTQQNRLLMLNMNTMSEEMIRKHISKEVMRLVQV